jgi:hypothetical protein
MSRSVWGTICVLVAGAALAADIDAGAKALAKLDDDWSKAAAPPTTAE